VQKIKIKYKMWLQVISGILLVFILSIIIFVKFAPQFGARSKGERFTRIYHSSNFSDGKFQNLEETSMSGPNTSMWKNGLKFLKKIPGQVPDKPIETVAFNKKAFLEIYSGIKACWFGHSCVLLNINGTVVLTDPVFSEKASPVSFVGVKRFDYTHQYTVEDMPQLDLVLISHDHYDHLDYQTILKLHHKANKFCVPLGVAAHLIHWGVPEHKIIELDWHESTEAVEGLKIFSTPSRHFSGRAGVDKDYTLWCSFVIQSDKTKLFYCGDSGYGKHFRDIGEKYGPFDFTMMECGQYNEGWPYIHMNPEEAVQAHIDLFGGLMLPIHWGKFKLSLHPWQEPIERAIAKAEELDVKLLNPKPGEIFIPKTVFED
jgi:L-ascorbate metabolism protein UlaG (beta-lactamase superfamily)